MKIIQKITVLSLVALSVVSCNKKETDFTDPLVTNRDTTANPADDFFTYANGGWFKKHPIPASERSNGIFRMIQDTINNQIKNICESSAKANDVKGSNKQKIGDFYASGMDSVAINKAGIAPMKGEFSKIEAIKDIPGLLQTIAYLHTIGTGSAFSFYVSQDDKNSAKNALQFMQGGLGLGQRDYYFDTDKNTTNIRNEYVKHIQAMMELAGEQPDVANQKAKSIMKLETELAKSSRKLADLRDPLKNYNKMSVAQFNTVAPNINWNQMLIELKIKNSDSVIVGQPEFYKALSNCIKTYSIDDWKSYLKWNVLNSFAAYLNKDIEDQNFKFYATIMSGVKEQKPRRRLPRPTSSSRPAARSRRRRFRAQPRPTPPSSR